MSTTPDLKTVAVQEELPIVNDFLSFLNKSASQFHATAEAASMLLKAGFKQIYERNADDWKFAPGGKYFFVRNQSSIVAFAVGGKYQPGNGFSIVGAHTDSPVLKVKPVSNSGAADCLQVAVEPYGGGLWYTWFDRDLSLAGRVIVANADGKFESRLVRIDRPLLRIPSLAIHLSRGVNEEGFAPNKQQHLAPLLATELKAALAQQSQTQPEAKGAKAEHHPLLLVALAQELEIEPSAIRDFELCLYDTQPAQLGGLLNEFIQARGLDNLMMSFIGMRALIDSERLAEEDQVRMCALFDNEEIGSASVMGAASAFMPSVLKRVHGGEESTFEPAMRKSMLISADMAHALHPNYTDRHEPNHRPQMHKGLVVKYNANQRYATNVVTAFHIQEIAKRHGLPIQKFCTRSDMGCGSTIGPILSAQCGVRTVDVGVPQLSMHSIREMAGTADTLSAYKLLKAFYEEFSALDKNMLGADM